MKISLRSQMIAGTAAVVGASAIALTPVVAQHEMLPNIQIPSTSAVVALAGFDSPVTELIRSLDLVNSYLFSSTAVGQPDVTLGLVPQIIADHLPIISQLGVNGSDYIFQSFHGLYSSAAALSEGLWNSPDRRSAATSAGAITTLSTAIHPRSLMRAVCGELRSYRVLTRRIAAVVKSDLYSAELSPV